MSRLQLKLHWSLSTYVPTTEAWQAACEAAVAVRGWWEAIGGGRFMDVDITGGF